MKELELPDGWIKAKVNEISINSNNLRKPVSVVEREKIQGSFPYYGATGQIDSLNDFTHEGEYILIGEDGANLLSKSKPLAFIVDGKYWVNNHAHSIKGAGGIPNRFLSHYINSLDLSPWVTGSAQPKLTRGNLDAIPVPLPPLAEQQVIADKLDTLLAQVESIKARLERIPEILKQFRQSVLAVAVSGKLTDLESSWQEKKLKDCFDCIDGDRGPNYPKKDDYLNEGYCLFLSTKNVREFGFDFKELVFISREKDLQLRKGKLERGDIVITTRGTLGYVASYDDSVPFDEIRINSGMLILRKKNKEFVNDFFKILIASPVFQRLISLRQTGSAQPQLPAGILKDFDLAFPSVEEQMKIVSRVQDIFTRIDLMEQQVNSALDRVSNLTQSILAKAFRGELTAEWREANPELISGENSAEALLERIKAERASVKPATKRGRGKA
ncbi:restriction endonuclease subunit S [Acinetobacter pittii]|uniref:restriction endonuclease subunit S n=1 Tax=Acinetobacter pittii TaxID=48296 RepID=UPI001BD07139|nr:restriction endonuclease subunit S [Acinetobacter pittii]